MSAVVGARCQGKIRNERKEKYEDWNTKTCFDDSGNMEVERLGKRFYFQNGEVGFASQISNLTERSNASNESFGSDC